MDLQPVATDPRRRGWATLVLGAAVAAVVCLLAVALHWHHEGGRWYAVTSPSMGEVMPTGSLIVTEPTGLDEVEVGEVVTFRSPGSRTVFSHRVVGISPDGLTTRGDVNLADDAWTIGAGDLIGTVAWQVPGVGWLLRGVPLLLLGLALTWVLAMLARPARRPALRLLGASVTAAVVNLFLHPWVGLDQLAQTTPSDGSRGVLMQVISTGLLPIRAFEVDGSAQADLRNGEADTLHLTHHSNGQYDLAARLDLAWWGWALLVVVILSPLAASLVGRRRTPVDVPVDDEPAPLDAEAPTTLNTVP